MKDRRITDVIAIPRQVYWIDEKPSGVYGPQAICVECFVIFSVSQEVDEWIRNSEGARVLCPDCYHKATGVDDFNDEVTDEQLPDIRP